MIKTATREGAAGELRLSFEDSVTEIHVREGSLSEPKTIGEDKAPEASFIGVDQFEQFGVELVLGSRVLVE